MRRSLSVAALVAGATTALAAGAEAPPLPLACFGTEPFWSLEIGREAAAFERADGDGERFAVRALRAAEGRSGELSLAALDGVRLAYAILERERCSDGMSDRVHPWSVLFLRRSDDGETTLLEGCCRPAGTP